MTSYFEVYFGKITHKKYRVKIDTGNYLQCPEDVINNTDYLQISHLGWLY